MGFNSGFKGLKHETSNGTKLGDHVARFNTCRSTRFQPKIAVMNVPCASRCFTMTGIVFVLLEL